MTNMLAGSLMPLLTIKRLIAIRCWGATLTFFLAKTLRLLVEPCLPSSQSIFSVYFPSMARNQSETKTWNQFKKQAQNTYFISFYLICCTVIKTWEQNEPEKMRTRWRSDALLSTQMHCYLLRCITIYWDAPNILFFMHCLHLLLPHILLSVGAANKYSMLLQRTPSPVAKSHKNDLAHFPISLSSVATFVSDHDMTKSHILPAIIFCLGREYFQGQFFMSKLWKTSPVQTIPKAKVTFRLSVILGLQN